MAERVHAEAKVDEAALQGDLTRLYELGSGDAPLRACANLARLFPVQHATNELQVPVDVGVLTLLEMVAENAHPHELTLLAGAALTGVRPRSINRGVRGGERQASNSVHSKPDEPPGQNLSGGGCYARKKAAADIVGLKPGTAFRNHAREYYDAYAGAILLYAQRVKTNDSVRTEYARRCRLAQGNEHSSRPDAKDIDVLEGTQASSPGSSTIIAPGASALEALPLASNVHAPVDAALTACEASNRAFYTPDLMLALLEVPGNRVGWCFNQVQPGLARSVQERLRVGLARTPIHEFQPFQPDFDSRPDVGWAQRFARRDRAAVVTELHLFLGVLVTESNTQRQLKRLLGAGFARLEQVVGKLCLEDSKRGTPGHDEGYYG